MLSDLSGSAKLNVGQLSAVGAYPGSNLTYQNLYFRSQPYKISPGGEPILLSETVPNEALDSSKRLACTSIPCSTINAVRRIPLIRITRDEILGSALKDERAEAG